MTTKEEEKSLVKAPLLEGKMEEALLNEVKTN